jgi:glucose/arabinose dehydrogenase
MKRAILLIGLLVGLLSAFAYEEHATAATLRSGFKDQLVASVGRPTALAFTPDGRMLIATQPGQLRVYKGRQLLQTPALDLSSRICSNSERGLLGVAVDPDFATNHYIYLYYTFNKFGVCPQGQPSNSNNPINRVSRFVMSGDSVDPASEQVLINNIPSPNGNHNGGDLHVGKDGNLYVSVGDGGCDYAGDSGCAGSNDASRDRNVLLGKVLRVTREGDIPPDNPFQGDDSTRCNVAGSTNPAKICQETFAWGFRNPFRMAFDPNAPGTRFFVNDVGQNAWEEVDQGQAGADYGWNLCEGTHDNPSRPGSVDCTAPPYTPPVHEYSHDAGCASITGAAFVPDGTSWPTSYDDSYLFGDYVCGKIFELTPTRGGGFDQSKFASGLGQGGPVDMTFGSSGSGDALYFTTYANGGEIHRIAYVGANNSAPNAFVTADPTTGPVPLDVTFDGSGSSDPDGGALTYVWDFGDGSPPQTTDTPTTNHAYSAVGTYTATLTVRDTSGAEDAATVRIEVDDGAAADGPPILEIESPTQDKTFAVGEKIVLHGGATDPEDGTLPESALSWEVLQYHNNSHTHPYLSPTPGNDVEITSPAPEDLFATDPAGNYLEIRLTATDSTGHSSTVTQALRPHAVDVALDSQPAGIELLVNGTTIDSPKTITSWEGYELKVSAPRHTTLAGTTYLFNRWSDDVTQPDRSIITNAEPKTYTAIYTPCTIAGTPHDDVLKGTPGNDIICGRGGGDTLIGRGGDDMLRGGLGDDKLGGGSGSDILRGGPERDELSGGTGEDSLRAGEGDDDYFGDGGDDHLNSKDGVSGNDSLDGGADTDTCKTDSREASIVGCP